MTGKIFCQLLYTLSNAIYNSSNKLAQVESSLVATKTVNDNLLDRITSLERSLHAQEHHSRECLEIVSIPTFVDDKKSRIGCR